MVQSLQRKKRAQQVDKFKSARQSLKEVVGIGEFLTPSIVARGLGRALLNSPVVIYGICESNPLNHI